MKKLVFLLLAVFTVTLVSAQDVSSVDLKKQFEKSERRRAELSDLCASLEKKSGDQKVDNYAKAVVVAATTAMTNSETLENFYYREGGVSKDGITEITEKKPTIEEWSTLAVGIAGESASITAASNLAEEAIKSAKSQKNPMKAAKIMKHCDTSAKVLKILGEESVESAKAVNQIVETLKSGKNL